MIAESAANDARLVRTHAAGGLGLDGVWSDDFHHALHAAVTGERSGYYADYASLGDLATAFTRGWVYDDRYSAFRDHRFGSDPTGLPADRFVVCAQNHDQVGNRARGERLGALTRPGGPEVAAAAVLLSPFVPLLFMGEEYGEPAPFPYFVSHSDPDLVAAVRAGRAAEFADLVGVDTPDPQDPATFASAVLTRALADEEPHRRRLGWYRALLALRAAHPALRDPDLHAVRADVQDAAVVVARGPDRSRARARAPLRRRARPGRAPRPGPHRAARQRCRRVRGHRRIRPARRRAHRGRAAHGGPRPGTGPRPERVTRRLVTTYRLQLDPTFDLAAATRLVDHLTALGVSHAYLSPVFAARPGSTHGYDVVDPTQVRDELGGRRALDTLAAALHDRGLGIVLDIVPNHLAADEHNGWWWSVLRDGARSPHAAVFDIDWPAGGGRVILPVLGTPLGDALRAGDLATDAAGAEPVLAYFDRRFPLRPDVDPALPLPDLLAAQHYLLTHWRAPARNVRRFFDIDDLVGVRVEDPAVFATTHALVLELVAAGVVDALRVDHVDGLRDPQGYLERLADATGVPILVEKVLGPDEQLSDAWPVAGTTGYEHLADLDALFVDGAGWATIDRAYRADGGEPFAAVERAARGQVLADLFPSEWAARAAEAATVLGIGPDVAAGAVRDLTLGLDVYRTYVVAGRPVAADDRARLLAARRRFRAGAAEVDDAGDRLVDRLVTGDRAATEWAARWQQLSGAVMAKGHEDTAYYRETRLLALDEVGGDPDAPRHADALERFHAHQQRRLTTGRAGLTTTTTHDTKRSEDARARLLALSELPDLWEPAFPHVRAGRARTRSTTTSSASSPRRCSPPGPRTTTAGRPTPTASRPTCGRRSGRRSGRRAGPTPTRPTRRRSSRSQRSRLDARGVAFDRTFGGLRTRLAVAGAVTSLTRLVVKHAAPGPPDVYRGCERWALELADPDNRRPVDHARDVATLTEWAAAPPDLAELRRHWTDGRIKLWCTWRSLVARRARSDLFLAGTYTPLRVSGPDADAIIAFARTRGPEVAIVIGARRAVLGVTTDGFPIGASWTGTEVTLPPELPPLRDALRPDGDPAGPIAGRVDDALRRLPVALFVTEPVGPGDTGAPEAPRDPV